MDQVNSIAFGRIGIGVITCIAPTQAFKVAGFTAAAQAPYLGRMFGVREIAMGAMTLAARPDQRRQATMIGIGVDTVDALGAVLGMRSGALGKPAGVGLTALALAAVGGGVAGLQQIRRGVPRP